MADIEFVIEAPQVTRSNKKRPRLVTSCDHCRVKKIKCVQQPSTGTCEACMSANLPCLYRDREQYFAERTRMLSGAASALRDASTSAHSRGQLSAINTTTSKTSRVPSPSRSNDSCSSSYTDRDHSNSPPFYSYGRIAPLDVNTFPTYSSPYSFTSERPTWDGHVQPLSWSPHRHSPVLGTSVPPTPIAPQVSPLVGLFDPSDQCQPHPNLMVDFLHVFFEKLGPSFPFLSSETVCERFLHHQLPPLLANSVAASAARLSTVPEIMHYGPANSADVYCQFAKSLVPPENAPGTLDTVHALMLIAWAEYKRGRQTTFNAYSRSVIQLASEMGISEDTLPGLTRVSDAHGARVLQATWQGIQLLERTLLASEFVSFSGGNSPTHSVSHHPPHQHAHSSAPAVRSVTSLW